MLKEISTSEFHEMMSYASLEPFGEYRQELRHGQLMNLLHTANFKCDKKLAPIDFMNFTDRPEEPKLSQEEIQNRIDKEIFGL